MRRTLLALALAFAAVLAPGLAAAQTLEGQQEALATLGRSLSAAAKGSPAPRLSDPAQSRIIRAAFDERALTQVDWSDLGGALDVCDSANKTMSGYMFEGTGVDLSKPLDQLDAATIGKLNANIVRYQDELSLGTAFVVGCMARVVGPAGDFWDKLPEADRTASRVQGLRQLRGGVLGMYKGAIQTQTEAVTTLSNKTLILGALLRNNRALGMALSPAERTAAINAIDAALPNAAESLRPDLIKVRDALKTMPCKGLCSA